MPAGLFRRASARPSSVKTFGKLLLQPASAVAGADLTRNDLGRLEVKLPAIVLPDHVLA